MLIGLMMTITAMAQETETVVLQSGKFTGVKANSGAKIYLVQADSNKVTVSPADFNIKKLKLEIKDGILNVEAQGVGDKAKIYIYSPVFDYVELTGATDAATENQINGQILHINNSGASDVKADVQYKIVEIRASGASDIKLKGQVDTFDIEVSGASDLKAFEVKNVYAIVLASGASDVQINTDSTLIANISGASSIKFQKEPAYKDINSGDVALKTVPKTIWVDDGDISVEENNDSTKITYNGNEIIVIEKDGETKVLRRKVEPTASKKKNKFKGNWVGLELGVNGYLSPNYSLDLPTEYNFLELNYSKSTNFNFNFFQQSIPIFGNKFGLVTGMGVQWNNYKFNNTSTTLKTDSGKINGYFDTIIGRTYSKSKLTTTSLTVPILFEYQTNQHHNTNSFHLSAGIIAKYTFMKHTKQVYSDDGSGKNKPKTYGDFYLQPFNLDATVRIGWGPLNLYGSYSIFEMFRNNKGPELYPFSVGVILPFS